MPDIKYPQPINFRPSEDDLLAIEKIIAYHSQPGVALDRSKAVKIALNAYAATLPLVKVAPDAKLVE